MSEAKRNNRTLKEIVSDATDRDLERYETGILTPDRLKKLASEADKRKKRRYRRIAGIAALFVVVVAGAIMVFDFADTDVEADKNSKEEIVTEDGSIIIEDGGWGSSSEDGWIITDWAEVEIAKATIPELIVPGYIPEGYEFKKLYIENFEGGHVNYNYLFCENEKTLEVKQSLYKSNISSYEINNYEKKYDCFVGDVYIQNTGDKKAIIQIDDGSLVEVIGEMSDSELIKIIEKLDF